MVAYVILGDICFLVFRIGVDGVHGRGGLLPLCFFGYFGLFLCFYYLYNEFWF